MKKSQSSHPALFSSVSIPKFSELCRNERLALGWLIGIILLGAWLRFAGIGWSLPDARHPLATYHPDELINLNAARSADFLHGQFDIGFYNYGAFYFYLVSFAQLSARGWGLIPTTAAGMSQFSPQAAAEMAGLFLTGRVVTALMGIATIPLLHFTGKRFYHVRAGLIAAMLYAVAPLAVVHAHFLTVDVPATLFVTLTLFFTAKILPLASVETQRHRGNTEGKREDEAQENAQRPTPNAPFASFALMGVAAGLAMATKYTAGTVILAPIAAILWARPKSGIEAMVSLKSLGVLLGAFLVAFLVGCPGVFLNFDAFWNGLPNFPGSGLRYELFEHSRQGHGLLFVNTGIGWWYHLWISLRFGLGLPLWFASIFGVASALKRRERADKILLTYLLVTFVLTGFSAVRFARYMIPLFPPLFLLVGKLLSDLKLSKPTSHDEKVRITLVLFVGIVTLGYTQMFVGAMQGRDPRDKAADYIEQNLRGKSIAFAKIPWFYSPPLSPYLGAPAAPVRAKIAQSPDYQFRVPATEWSLDVLNLLPDAVIVSNFETMHDVNRLHLPDATRFMERVEQSYSPHPFGRFTYEITFPYGGGSLIPEDLLYVVPQIYVYLRKER